MALAVRWMMIYGCPTTRPPLIDAGDNDAIALTTDLDGNTCFYDDADVVDTGNGTAPIVDMGAYDKQSSSSGVTLYLPIVVKED